MNFLLIGEDEFSKDEYIANIKKEAFKKEFEGFNFDCLYAQEIKDKHSLQESFLRLPQGSTKRVILIKNVERLRKDIEDCIKSYLKNPFKHLVLILESRNGLKWDSINSLRDFKAINFKKSRVSNGLDLNKAIANRRPDLAVKILSDLIKDGQKPHFILGGILGYIRKRLDSLGKKRASIALNCILRTDLEIKTGKLQPEYAIEKLLVQLCLV